MEKFEIKALLSKGLTTLKTRWLQYRGGGSPITNASPGWLPVLMSVLSSVLVLALFTMYVRQYFFLFDDYSLVGLAGAKHIVEVFTEGLIGFYRPVAFAFFQMEYALFHWHTPGGYALVSCVLHFANALLAARLVRLTFPHERSMAWVSFTVCLLSPWASETFFWSSCQFDLVGTLFGLLAISVAVQSSSAETSTSMFCISIIATAILTSCAVFTKESFIVLPALFLVFALYRHGAPEIFRRGRIVGAAAIMALSVVAYLIVRANVLSAFTGAYGNYFDLLRHPHPLHLAYAFLVPPIDRSNTVLFEYYRPLFAILTGLVLLISFANHPRETTISFFGFVCSLIPVLPFDIGSNSTAGGRFIYFPGVFAAIAYAHGLVEGSRADTGKTALHVTAVAMRRIVTVLFFLYMAMSLGYQQTLWSQSTRIARSCMEQFGRLRNTGTHFYITNLPHAFVQGPYVLRPYAFSYYYPNSGVRVRADRTWLSYDHGKVLEFKGDQDPFSQYRTNADEIELTLDCVGDSQSSTPAR